MPRRSLTLDEVPDELLAEHCLRRGGATTAAYRCSADGAVPVPIADVIGPSDRKLNRDALADILRGFRDGNDIPPVLAYRDAATGGVALLHGAHRWRASLAYGFTHIPCLLVSLTEALETGYTPGLSGR